MENINKEPSKTFDNDKIEEGIKVVLSAIEGLPKDIADMTLIGALVAVSRIHFEAEGNDPKNFGGFEIEARATDIDVKVSATKANGFASLLAAMLGKSNGSQEDAIASLFGALAATKDNPESEGYCDCSNCTERRAMMAEANKGPEIH